MKEQSESNINFGRIPQNEGSKSTLSAAIKLVYGNETYMLERLIQQHGEVKGVEYFNYMKRESRELWEDLQKIGGPEPREEEVDISKTR